MEMGITQAKDKVDGFAQQGNAAARRQAVRFRLIQIGDQCHFGRWRGLGSQQTKAAGLYQAGQGGWAARHQALAFQEKFGLVIGHKPRPKGQQSKRKR
jgi:hypothetical protein